MKSVKKLVIVITLGSAIALSGCGVQKSGRATYGSNTQTNIVEKKPLSIEDGSKNMKDVLKDMKIQLSNKEEDKAAKTSEKLEENWSSFEDVVKEKNSDLYEKVEAPLGVIQSGVKVKPVDTKTITTAIETLDEVLTEIQSLK